MRYLQEHLNFNQAKIRVLVEDDVHGGKTLYMEGVCIEGGVRNANEDSMINEFFVRDYAAGLSEYDIRNVFGMYFRSTKSNSNNQIGGIPEMPEQQMDVGMEGMPHMEGMPQ